MIVTKQGQLIRMPVKGISVMGRNTQGVRLVNLSTSEEAGNLLPDMVGGVTRVVPEDDLGAVIPEGEAASDVPDGVEPSVEDTAEDATPEE
jgi:DNA gyrase subunit A